MIGNAPFLKLLTVAFCLWFSHFLAGQTSSHAEDTRLESGAVSDNGVNDEVYLRLEQPVSSGSARKGDLVRLTLTTNLWVDGKLIAPAGASFHATVAHVRVKTRHRKGEIWFSDADLDAPAKEKVRLYGKPPREKFDPSVIPFVVLMGVTLVPMTAAAAPISLPWWVIHEIHERRGQAKTPRPEPSDAELPVGETVEYYARAADFH
jgi:hypothetical protein